MTRRILVCGSLAFDMIAVFEGRFKDHILPEHVPNLSVSFFVPALRKEFGGCAGNISYNLALLGAQAVPVGTVGHDADEYLERMRALGIETDMIKVVPEEFSAQCFITTDMDSNQIASFHPGAMQFSSRNDLSGQKAAWAIVAPDAKEAMLAHAERLQQSNIPFVFDLGQAMPLFDGDDLNKMIDMADVLTANDYEATVIQERTGKSMDQIAQQKQAVIVTHGAKGAMLYHNGSQHQVAPVEAAQVLDPTGCGDAHRAGLLYGLTAGWSMYEAACLGNIMGSIKIASQGPQNHQPKRDQINRLLAEVYELDVAVPTLA
ncbi:MAG TPA: carbohydrate kinase family protein [Paenalcaligenes sp.]|nr:carbohydrate kinase family protein [Paenalcaligenes sp.]